jgi:hypothetical protein
MTTQDDRAKTHSAGDSVHDEALDRPAGVDRVERGEERGVWRAGDGDPAELR